LGQNQQNREINWAKPNKTETKKTKKPPQRINKTKSWFFEMIKKIDKPIANLTKMKRVKSQINKIRNTK
jgi:hypothetical protein